MGAALLIRHSIGLSKIMASLSARAKARPMNETDIGAWVDWIRLCNLHMRCYSMTGLVLNSFVL